MRKIYKYILLSLVVLAGCRSDESVFGDGEGALRLGVQMKNDVQIAATRALTSDEIAALEKECKIRIYDTDKLIRRYQGISEVPETITLPSGEYRVRVTAGDSVAASFDKKFYEAVKPFTITQGSTVPVDVVCNIANTVTKVAFAESVNKIFQDCGVEISVKAEDGALNFNADNLDKMGYFSLPADCDTLFCKFTGTIIATGKPFQYIDTIPAVSAATRYDLTFQYKDMDIDLPDTGGGMIQLQVDATPIGKVEDEAIFYRRPVVTASMAGEAIDLTVPYYIETNAGSETVITFKGSSALARVELSSEQLPEFLGTNVSVFDLMNLSPEDEMALNNGGITVSGKEESKGYSLNVIFSAALIQKYTATDGTRDIRFAATDVMGKTRNVDWQLIVSNAAVKTENAPIYMTWATKATLYGSVLPGRDPQGDLTFQYRKVGAQNWSVVNAIRENLTITAEVQGLEPGTTYEYQLIEGEIVSSVKCTITTEVAMQFENAGFEDWHGSLPKLIYADGGSMFWDSGNHGSKTANVDVTTDDTGVKHSGARSVKLRSQDAKVIGIGQFAAGNLFIGKYLDTKMDGLKGNGILGWGRPFTSRPLALRGYIKYAPTKVTNPLSGKLTTDDYDRGIVYIAMGDWKGEAYSGTSWPVIVQTDFNNPSKAKLFDSTSGEVIAYGEKIFTENTSADNSMIEFTIPLTYRSNRIPTAIILVASSSQYGDYFAGGVGSTMWLDDLELIYDESELTK